MAIVFQTPAYYILLFFAMDHRNNLKFKGILLNIRGIRAFEKRKSLFNLLINQNADICFLQETL